MAFYERYQQKEIGQGLLRADRELLPELKKGETFQINMAQFPDHGRPCFVGSSIKSNPITLELARGLTPEESRKVNERFRTEVERILDSDQTRRVATLSGKGIPDIHVLTVGDPFDPKSLRVYYLRTEYNGTPAIVQRGIARIKDSHKLERLFQQGGYQLSEGSGSGRIH